ncbi:MAG TPA: hypothetical protein PKW80_16495, partial [Bacteroidales bacterium]|nr:hypothetical protein [Bacteroidales bacterium]
MKTFILRVKKTAISANFLLVICLGILCMMISIPDINAQTGNLAQTEEDFNLIKVQSTNAKTGAKGATATLETTTGICPGDTVLADITLSGFTSPIVGFQFTIRFDTNHLKYLVDTNWYPGITQVWISHNYYGAPPNVIDGLTFVWGDGPANVADILCQLVFIYKTPYSGCQNLSWSDMPTPRLFADTLYNEFVVTYVDGMICPLLPEEITGTTPICAGETETWSGANPGGIWSSSDPSVAAINSTSGVVTAVSAGTSLITYIVTEGNCVSSATKTVTVTAPITQDITGPTEICVGSTGVWTSTTSGGTWSSSEPATATVDINSGIITGVASGTSVITYTVTVGACTNTASQTVTITTPVPQTISGTTPLCEGYATIWTSTTSGGTWTSNTPGVA